MQILPLHIVSTLIVRQWPASRKSEQCQDCYRIAYVVVAARMYGIR